MPKAKTVLTDRGLKALKPAPAGKRYVVWDAVVPGFGVRVTENGHRSFIVRRRLPGARQPLRYALDPTLTLEKARDAARDVLQDLAKGKHPTERLEEERRQEEAKRQAEAARRRDTLPAAAEEFMKRHIRKLRSAKAAESIIRRELLGQTRKGKQWADDPKNPRWRERPITEITRRDVVALLEEIVDDGRPYMARQVLACARKFYNWAIARSVYGLEHSPCDRISARDIIGKLAPRDRTLTNDEMRDIWLATEGKAFAPFVRMLMITGQRRNEVARMRWSEVNEDEALWTIPAERMKGKRPHEVPLSPPALQLLTSLPHPAGAEYAFSTTDGKKAISGFGKMKKRLDEVIAKLHEGEKQPAPWRFHDLRRTMRTALGTFKTVPQDVRELVIGHIPSALMRTYDLHDYRDEKREALTLWAQRLQAIIEPPPKNVVPISTRTKR